MPEVLIILLLLFVAVAVIAAVLDETSARRRQIEQRAHMAEMEIDEIAERTQLAILEEARRRAHL
jgi:Tfp pilus assembly protein PilV